MVTNSVRKYRSKAKMTQEELGKEIGVSRQTIIAIEKGDYTPSIMVALKIAQVFKLPVEKIFFIEGMDKFTPMNSSSTSEGKE